MTLGNANYSRSEIEVADDRNLTILLLGYQRRDKTLIHSKNMELIRE